MEEWQVEILKYGVTAVGSGAAAVFGYWKWMKKRQAEYEDLKKKRRLEGTSVTERLEKFGTAIELIAKMKQHGITSEDFQRLSDEVPGLPKRRRTRAKQLPPAPDPFKAAVQRYEDQKSGKLLDVDTLLKLAPFDERLTEDQQRAIGEWFLNLLRERGPSNNPVGFDDEGNKVEWLRRDDGEVADGMGEFTTITMLRNQAAIYSAMEEYIEKLWWADYQNGIVNHSIDAAVRQDADAHARRIQEKYALGDIDMSKTGYDSLTRWGEWTGKLAALRWVAGWDWADTPNMRGTTL